MKRTVLLFFLTILAVPLVLWGVREPTGEAFDVELSGFTESAERPALLLADLLNGGYQDQYTKWFETKLPFRGVMTRTYNTIRFLTFRTGNLPIGKNDTLFEYPYIEAKLSLKEYDYASEEQQQKLRTMVEHLVSVDKKLRAVGKYLYVYIGANKADVCFDALPYGYKAVADPDAVNLEELLRSMLEDTGIQYLFCSDLVPELNYPPFYTTGIHWSRTFEQTVSQRVISDLKSLTGKAYRNLNLVAAESRHTPFWRDNDAYDLLNLWFDPDIEYHQFAVEPESDGSFERMDLLLQGDSFSRGLQKDISEYLPDAWITWLGKNHEMIASSGIYSLLGENWETVNFQQLLDCADVVLIELVEPEIAQYTYGFLPELDNYLDNYHPLPKEIYYLQELDAAGDYEWNLSFAKGVYGKENGFSWLSPECTIILKNHRIASDGIQIEFEIPQELFREGGQDTVSVLVNDEIVFEKKYSGADSETVLIPPGILHQDSSETYVVKLLCSAFFRPDQIGNSTDERELAMRLKYIGSMR